MKSASAPTSLAAVGVLLLSALAFNFHLFLHWVFLSGFRWPMEHRIALTWAFGATGLVSWLLLVVGVSWLLRRTFRIWRLGAAAWALAVLPTPFWPLATLLPVARRLGHRRAARLAIWSGIAILLASSIPFVSRVAGLPLYWPMLLGCLAGMGLALATLRALDGTSHPHRMLGWAFALVGIVSIATQPMFHVGRVRCQADAAFATLLESIGSTISPDALLAARTPVPEKDDPIAALDKEAMDAEEWSIRELRRMLWTARARRHPLTPEEIAAADAWFASHTNLAAKADFLSASPDYCSCLPSPPTLAEGVQRRLVAREPRISSGGAMEAANLLDFRARVALAAGNGAAGANAFRRIRNLIALGDRELTLLDFLQTVALRGMAFRLLATRIDLWSEDDLLAVQRAVDEDLARVETRIRDAMASECLWNDAGFDGTMRAAFEAPSDMFRGSGVLDYWVAAERRALYRSSLVTWEAALRFLENWPTNNLADAVLRRLEANEEARVERLPPIASLMGTVTTAILNPVVGARDHAAFVHAAVAIERYRRAHGGELPPTLDTLVPDYLPAVPRTARTDEPMAYDPGPLDIPEEEVPALRDPDEAAEESKSEDLSWFNGLLSRDEAQEKEALRRFNEHLQQNDEEPKPAPRILPAVTLPGFRLTLPDSGGRANRDKTYDFFLGHVKTNSSGTLTSSLARRKCALTSTPP